jgi:murein DD-endopeptidase MepM/ murein hydrolase activator NlpD
VKIFIYLTSLLLLFGCAHTHVKKDVIIEEKAKQVKLKPTKLISKTEVSLLYPVKGGTISSPFGIRKGHIHRGVDIAADLGTHIQACEDGIVQYVGKHKNLLGYGNTILIKHQNGVYTYYAHLHNTKIKNNDKVKRGQVIGNVGNTGKSTGPHLHLELIMGGKNHNPVPYFMFDKSIMSYFSAWVVNIKKEVAGSKVIKCLSGEKRWKDF